MRHFRITNGNGDILDTTSEDILLTDPAGLGIERDTSFRRVGNRFITVSSRPKQLPFTGKIIFYGDEPYTQYYDAVKILSKPPLYLNYNPYGDFGVADIFGTSNYYTKRCELSKLSKTELDKEYGCLSSDLELIPLTPWYIVRAIEVHAQADSNQTQHNLKFPFKFPVRFGSSRPMNAQFDFTHSTMNEGPCRLRLSGPFSDPSWTHYVGSTPVSTGRLINCPVDAGEYLWIDNTTDPYSIYVGDQNGSTLIRDVYQTSDFSTQRFITMQPGDINTIVFNNLSGESIDVRVEVHEYYESV
jgi:hypothetical protein